MHNFILWIVCSGLTLQRPLHLSAGSLFKYTLWFIITHEDCYGPSFFKSYNKFSITWKSVDYALFRFSTVAFQFNVMLKGIIFILLYFNAMADSHDMPDKMYWPHTIA